MRGLIILVVTSLVAPACESGTGEAYTFNVSKEVATLYSAESPGILRVLNVSNADPADKQVNAVARILCGDPVPNSSFQFFLDHGLGCLDKTLKEKSVQRQAWIEEMPAGWDAAALCALPAEQTTIGPEVTGDAGSVELDFATTPLPEWSKGRGNGVWRRDDSPCGGRLEIEIRLLYPITENDPM